MPRGHDGNLYGTTVGGGSSSCDASLGGCGTIFRVTPPGTFATLHRLNGTEGAGPSGMIQGSDGNFYVTIGGGVLRFVPAGQFTVLTTFPPSNVDPTSADGPLVQASNGKLYGPFIGYSQDQAQFYEIDTSGKRIPGVSAYRHALGEF